MKTFINRYVWAYINWDAKKQVAELTFFTSPDANAVHLDTIPTPNKYSLVRNDVRYILESEVKLSEQTAIRIAGMMYDTEFVIAPKLPMKSQRRKK